MTKALGSEKRYTVKYSKEVLFDLELLITTDKMLVKC